VSFLASSEDIKEIKKAFKKLDLNQDGKISKEELLLGYKEIYGDLA
jgi:Ca2+-binding EF-hand superfamily protein